MLKAAVARLIFSLCLYFCCDMKHQSATMATVMSAEDIENSFTKTFDDSCLKYDFVRSYRSLLQTPNGRSVVMVFNENGLKNGGLGDRIGGIINAGMMALRFNRTLLIQSSNGFDTLFRPYAIDPRVNYSDAMKSNTWSRYNPQLSDHDETERDLYFCINRNDKDAQCGLESGDVPQPIIKLRGNRAYLCKWATHPSLPAFRELVALGISDSTDLFEVGGCLLRLAMWPTKKLFQAVADLRKTLLQGAIHDDSLLQIGVHYRCGDISFVHPNADRSCQHDEDGTDPHDEVVHMVHTYY